MAEGSSGLSREDLIKFLDFASDKGLIKKATAHARKIACNTVLGILDEQEAADLSKIDLEGVISRHKNKAAGKIAPITLKTYQSRVRIAVKDFLEYIKDPSGWQPTAKQRASRAKTPSAKKAKTTSLVAPSKGLEEQGKMGQPSIHIDFQIHISPEATPEQIDQIFAAMRRYLYGSA